MRRAIRFYKPLDPQPLGDRMVGTRFRVILDCHHMKELPSDDVDMRRVIDGKTGFTECKRCPPPIVIEEKQS